MLSTRIFTFTFLFALQCLICQFVYTNLGVPSFCEPNCLLPNWIKSCCFELGRLSVCFVAIQHVNIGLDPKEICGSMCKILPRFLQWILPRISLPVANLGGIPGKIAPRFLPPWICSLARILARFAVAFRRDFGRRDYCFSARILARFAAGSRQDYGRRDFCFSVRILVRFVAGSQRDFGREENLGGQNLAGIPTGSRQDPSSYFTRVGICIAFLWIKAVYVQSLLAVMFGNYSWYLKKPWHILPNGWPPVITPNSKQ